MQNSQKSLRASSNRAWYCTSRYCFSVRPSCFHIGIFSAVFSGVLVANPITSPSDVGAVFAQHVMMITATIATDVVKKGERYENFFEDGSHSRLSNFLPLRPLSYTFQSRKPTIGLFLLSYNRLQSVNNLHVFKLFILFVNHYLFLLLLIKQTIVCYLSLAISLNVLVSRLDIAV